MWSFLSIFARQPIGLASTSIMSRILTPDDYGLIGMAATLTALCQSVADMGLSWATIRHRELTRAQADNLFWINSAVGILLWVMVGLAGPALASFFGRPELAGLAVALGAAFALSGLAAQPAALLARLQRTRAIFVVEAASCTTGAVAAAVLAIRGWGYWSLVGQLLTTQLSRLVLVFAASGYRPGLPRAGAGTRGMVAFGGYLTGFALVTYVARNLDNILIGRFWGPAALGYYARAYFLMSLPLTLAANSLSGVMVPTLAALEDDRERLGRAYREAVRAVALIGLPIASLLLVAAPEVVLLLYGRRWGPVVPLLRWLSMAAMVQIVVASSGWLYIALGRGRALLRVGLALTAAQSAAIVAGIRWGPEGVAASYTLACLALAPATLWAAHRIAALRLSATFRSTWPALVATAAAMAAGVAAGEAASRMTDSPAALLTAKVAGGASTMLACAAGLIPELATGTIARLRRLAAGGP